MQGLIRPQNDLTPVAGLLRVRFETAAGARQHAAGIAKRCTLRSKISRAVHHSTHMDAAPAVGSTDVNPCARQFDLIARQRDRATGNTRGTVNTRCVIGKPARHQNIAALAGHAVGAVVCCGGRQRVTGCLYGNSATATRTLSVD